VKAVREAEAHPKERPFDESKLAKVPPILGSRTARLAGQRAQFTWALNQYDSADSAERKAAFARRMARYIATAPAKGFTAEQITQGKPYPAAEVAPYLEEAAIDVSLDEEPAATFNTVNGTWDQRAAVEERIRQKVESSIPHETTRQAALSFLALAIETADEDRGDAWYVREIGHGLRLMAGRLLAFEIRRSKVRVSVIGPVSDEVRGALGAEPEEDEEFKRLPGGLLLTFPVEHVAEAHSLLKDGLDSFIDAAMARVRRAVSLEDHVPEAVEYISEVVGRDLPQPEPLPDTKASEELDDSLDEDDLGQSREPRVRGRAPIFESGQRSITSLISDVERDLIGLPDLQRPFVWEDTKVRDLLDSLFVGFPVGTLVFWHISNEKDARALGAERPGLSATTLVIDGQQRLTSLYRHARRHCRRQRWGDSRDKDRVSAA
jgi:hypothetical protein